MTRALGYREQLREEPNRAGQWGVYNWDADRWLDIVFSSEADAKRAAGFLMKARMRPSVR